MFLYQDIKEVFDNLKSQKARTGCMSFGIMWAMLTFVILQGGSTSYYNGTMKALSYDKPIVHIYPRETQHKNIPVTKKVANDLIHNVHCLKKATIVSQHINDVLYGYKTYKRCRILGVDSEYDSITDLTIKKGRSLSKRDLEQAIPVCLIGTKIKKDIFGQSSAIGKFIYINHHVIYVIGVFDTNRNNHCIIISNTLSEKLFPKNNENISYIEAIPKPNTTAQQVEKAIHAYLSKQLNFNPTNKNAVWITDTRQSQHYKALKKFFSQIQIFIFFIGLGLILSGIISINNMMLLTIQDRTHELVIRKIMGAKTFHIIKLILLETILISLISGSIGIFSGKSIIHLINIYIIPKIQNHHIIDFTFSSPYILLSLIALGIAGCLAGIISAKKAININPINALNNE